MIRLKKAKEHALVRGYVGIFSALLSSSFFLWTTPSFGAPDYNKTPVFFVHGHGMYAESWNSLIAHLKDGGYPELYLRAIQLVPNNGANISAAERQIAPAVEKFLADINEFLSSNHPGVPLKTKVDLISHSMGSMSSRWYAAKLRPDRVRKWISLGGANHGSDVACGLSDPGADDGCPAFAKNQQGSLIQFVLNGAPHVADVDETPYGIGSDSSGVDSVPPDQNRRILYMTLRTFPDRWIKPEESVLLDGAGGLAVPIPQDVPAVMTSPGNILMTNGIGHDAMLTDSSTKKLVRTILEAKEKSEREVQLLPFADMFVDSGQR